jgi:hypothetical protein
VCGGGEGGRGKGEIIKLNRVIPGCEKRKTLEKTKEANNWKTKRKRHRNCRNQK